MDDNSNDKQKSGRIGCLLPFVVMMLIFYLIGSGNDKSESTSRNTIGVKNNSYSYNSNSAYSSDRSSSSSYSSSSKSTTSSSSSSHTRTTSSLFTNKFGTATTICAHAGCSNTIAPSGDTNCCTLHSNHCGECGQYIDEDALFCIDCILAAAGQND